MEVDNPLYLPKLASQAGKQFLGVLTAYKEEIASRVKRYHSKIDEIDHEIERCYKGIYSTPYHLYSLLIH